MEITYEIRQSNSQPAPFASIDAFTVYRAMWWEYESWETSARCDFNGVAKLNLRIGQKYHIKMTWQGKTGHFWVTPTAGMYKVQRAYFTY